MSGEAVLLLVIVVLLVERILSRSLEHFRSSCTENFFYNFLHKSRMETLARLDTPSARVQSQKDTPPMRVPPDLLVRRNMLEKARSNFRPPSMFSGVGREKSQIISPPDVEEKEED